MRETKEVVLLHPLRETRKVIIEAKKQEEHVPRHIELTAVSSERRDKRIKSNRIERFEKTTRPSVKHK